MSQKSPTDIPQLPAAPLYRRLMAMLYDGLLLTAILLIATAIITLPFLINTPAQAENSVPQAPVPLPVLQTLLFMTGFLFLAWFWTHGGQTLGMQVWRLRIQTRQGYLISWWQAMLRYIIATLPWLACGLLLNLLEKHSSIPAHYLPLFWFLPLLGIFWCLIDSEKMTWYDRYAETRMVLLPKKK